MIKTLKCKDTAAFFSGQAVPRWTNLKTVAERKLQMLNKATRLDDLKAPPNNRLEPLKGDRAGYFSIRINGQWRLCFRFEAGHAYEAEIVDYH